MYIYRIFECLEIDRVERMANYRETTPESWHWNQFSLLPKQIVLTRDSKFPNSDYRDLYGNCDDHLSGVIESTKHLFYTMWSCCPSVHVTIVLDILRFGSTRGWNNYNWSYLICGWFTRSLVRAFLRISTWTTRTFGSIIVESFLLILPFLLLNFFEIRPTDARRITRGLLKAQWMLSK